LRTHPVFESISLSLQAKGNPDSEPDTERDEPYHDHHNGDEEHEAKSGAISQALAQEQTEQPTQEQTCSSDYDSAGKDQPRHHPPSTTPSIRLWTYLSAHQG
jgi:hypothetical protein